MKLVSLFTGGKDSVYSIIKAERLGYNVPVLLTIFSKNPDSYMFHRINVEWCKLQAEAMGKKIVYWETKGEKEKEIEDLYYALKYIKESYGVGGVVTGAIKSIYQAERIQRVCDKLDLWCFNPNWLENEEKYLEKLLKDRIKFIITKISAYPLTKEFLGKEFDKELYKKLLKVKKYINIAGEGGEYETFVLYAPNFKKEIVIEEYETIMENENLGYFLIKKAKI